MIGLLKVWVAAHTVQILTTVNDTMLDLKRKLAHAEVGLHRNILGSASVACRPTRCDTPR